MWPCQAPPPLKEMVWERNGYQKWKEVDKVNKIADYETIVAKKQGLNAGLKKLHVHLATFIYARLLIFFKPSDVHNILHLNINGQS